jgi:hypothetical protein
MGAAGSNFRIELGRLAEDGKFAAADEQFNVFDPQSVRWDPSTAACAPSQEFFNLLTQLHYLPSLVMACCAAEVLPQALAKSLIDKASPFLKWHFGVTLDNWNGRDITRIDLAISFCNDLSSQLDKVTTRASASDEFSPSQTTDTETQTLHREARVRALQTLNHLEVRSSRVLIEEARRHPNFNVDHVHHRWEEATKIAKLFYVLIPSPYSHRAESCVVMLTEEPHHVHSDLACEMSSLLNRSRLGAVVEHLSPPMVLEQKLVNTAHAKHFLPCATSLANISYLGESEAKRYLERWIKYEVRCPTILTSTFPQLLNQSSSAASSRFV